MKVIDLLNKIAKGEDVPKEIRIEHWCYNFKWIDHLYNYYDEESDTDLTSALSLDIEELNYNVKILDKEYEDIEELSYAEWNENKYDLDKELYYIKKINALIRNQKKIIERINNENI